MSMARRTFPSRLELKSPAGSSSEAPLKNVSLTTLLYVSPVQIPPWCDHTGTPGLVAFLHFHSSTTSGSACLIRPRTLARVSPRQSPSSLIFASISCEGDSPFSAELLVIFGTLPGAPGRGRAGRRGGVLPPCHAGDCAHVPHSPRSEGGQARVDRGDRS